jgi:hypothetical protein
VFVRFDPEGREQSFQQFVVVLGHSFVARPVGLGPPISFLSMRMLYPL